MWTAGASSCAVENELELELMLSQMAQTPMLHRGRESIVICIHVYGSLIWCSDDGLLSEFYAAWNKQFPPLQKGLQGASTAE